MSTATETAANPAENVKVAQDAMRRYADEATSINRTLFTAWANTVQAALRTAFEFHNASIQASRAVLDSNANANRAWFDQTTELVRKGQDATVRMTSAGLDLIDSNLPKRA